MAFRRPKPWDQVKPPSGTPLNWSNPLTRGILGAWVFNEGGGNIARDATGKDIYTKGTLTAGAVWKRGQLGLTAASSQYVAIAGNPGSSPAKWSIVARATKASSGAMTIFSTGYSQPSPPVDWFGAYARVGTSNFGFTKGNVYSYLNSVEPSLNVPHSLVFQYDGANLFQYTDGILQTSGFTGGSAGTPDFNSLATTTIGTLSSYVTQFWNGTIDYVYFYNRALSVAEIRDIHTRPFQMFNFQTRTAFITPQASAFLASTPKTVLQAVNRGSTY